jgi:hypothetical protein
MADEPSEEQTYRKGIDDHLSKQDKQLDEISKSLEEQRGESYRTSNSLSRIEIKTESIDTQARYTNGKVRKIIIALVFLGGIVIGQQFGSWHDIISVIASAV